jgi:hypothetical protein
MKRLGKIAGVCILVMVLVAFMSLPRSNAATEEQIEQALEKGLAWLAGQQDPGSGYWQYWWFPGDFANVNVGVTGLAVLTFEQWAKALGSDPLDPAQFEYADNVIDGLDYIFSKAGSDENGVHFIGSTLDVYNTSIAMMAVAASNAPGRVISTGALTGWTYERALSGMMEWLVDAQNDDLDCGFGGWAYKANVFRWGDNSNTGYAAFGLGFSAAPAPDGFGLEIPSWVLGNLSTFVSSAQDPVDGDQNDGGSWYRPCVPSGTKKWVNILKTGHLLYELALVGDDSSSTRVQDAIGYIETHWSDTGLQPEAGSLGSQISFGWKDSYHAMFTMMKGFEAFGIETVTVGGDEIDWYEEVSNVIVSNQNPDGWWIHINAGLQEGEEVADLRAAWAMLTLLSNPPTSAEIPVEFDIKPGANPNRLNLKSKGVFPVAILGTEGFDVTMIDPSTIRLTRDGVEGVAPLRWSYEDVASPVGGEVGDGYMDLTLKFDTEELVEILGLRDDAGTTIELTLTGYLLEEYGGTKITGTDSLLVLNPGKVK